MLFTRGPQQIRSKQVTVDQVVVISAKAGGATTLFFFFFFLVEAGWPLLVDWLWNSRAARHWGWSTAKQQSCQAQQLTSKGCASPSKGWRWAGLLQLLSSAGPSRVGDTLHPPTAASWCKRNVTS